MDNYFSSSSLYGIHAVGYCSHYLSPVLMTLLANSPPLSTSNSGTGDKFTAGVIDTGGAPRIFEKNLK
jgi:hypothetical protein